MAEKNKKIIFDEKTDSTINGFAVVLAFVVIGIILQFDNDFFGAATNFIKGFFIIIGILGLFTEVKNLNFRFDIKGLDNVMIGVFMLVIIFLMRSYINVDNWFVIIKYSYQLILFFLILICIYGFARGIIEMGYSIIKNYVNDGKNKKKNIFKNIMFVLTQLFGLLLVMAQIYDVFK